MTNATIVLKTIHNDIVTDNPSTTLTTKQMRAKLRVARRDDHVKNTSWVFTQDEADDIRAMFDAPFAERRAKREGASLTKAQLLEACENAGINVDELEGSGSKGKLIKQDLIDALAE